MYPRRSEPHQLYVASTSVSGIFIPCITLKYGKHNCRCSLKKKKALERQLFCCGFDNGEGIFKMVANYLISEYQFSINYNKFDEKVLCVDPSNTCS